MAEVNGVVPLRTRVYIDGYNLYYGCLKGSPYKWLDLLPLFEKHILPSALIERNGQPCQMTLLPLAIKFFTAKILEKAAKAPDSVSSQARYHTALRKQHKNRIEIIEGYYSLTESRVKIVDAAHPKRWPRDCQDALAWKLEEKQSDVNLALQAYHDAITQEVDQVVIVTNDTDIAPALKLIRLHTAVTIGLVIPAKQNVRIANTELSEQAHWVRSHILPSELADSQLPRVLHGKSPTIKPESWYARPDLLEKILQLAMPVVGSRGRAFKWMEEPNPYLENHAPIDLIDTEEEAAKVIAYIENYLAGNGMGK
ncbi:antitoxin Xre/MbcA/ParS toxin-binding domain-containing protein [Undibacterium sp. Ji67W]|uniref:antitoxin Xre/MbcA/ParS toxin-binding domain-containing protein n=1 Tax=Undibacterium sp. Ji67W TaxID=3413042 RepID=UPI003BF084AA